MKYVTKKDIHTKDTKGRDLKTNPHDFMRMKIEEKKKKDAEISTIEPPAFLMTKKREFITTFIEVLFLFCYILLIIENPI